MGYLAAGRASVSSLAAPGHPVKQKLLRRCRCKKASSFCGLSLLQGLDNASEASPFEAMYDSMGYQQTGGASVSSLAASSAPAEMPEITSSVQTEGGSPQGSVGMSSQQSGELTVHPQDNNLTF